MNAGAHGGETWERVRSGYDNRSRRAAFTRERSPGDYQVAYRSVTRINNENAAQDEWFIEALLRI